MEEQDLVEQQQQSTIVSSSSTPNTTNNNTSTNSSSSSSTRPREWRQKIESWLRDNETEHSPNTNRCQVTLTNRRSLEMDSGKS